MGLGKAARPALLRSPEEGTVCAAFDDCVPTVRIQPVTNITLLSKLQKTAPAEGGAECSFVNKLMPDHPSRWCVRWGMTRRSVGDLGRPGIRPPPRSGITLGDPLRGHSPANRSIRLRAVGASETRAVRCCSETDVRANAKVCHRYRSAFKSDAEADTRKLGSLTLFISNARQTQALFTALHFPCAWSKTAC